VCLIEDMRACVTIRYDSQNSRNQSVSQSIKSVTGKSDFVANGVFVLDSARWKCHDALRRKINFGFGSVPHLLRVCDGKQANCDYSLGVEESKAFDFRWRGMTLYKTKT